MSRKKEGFNADKKVGIYVCGITPYDTTHLVRYARAGKMRWCPSGALFFRRIPELSLQNV